MTARVKAISSVPVIASGGAGRLEDFAHALEAGADALLAASVFHFQTFTIAEVKEFLIGHGYPIRQVQGV
jgi:cyclase